MTRKPTHSFMNFAIIINGGLSFQSKRYSRVSVSLRISSMVSCILRRCSLYFWQLNKECESHLLLYPYCIVGRHTFLGVLVAASIYPFLYQGYVWISVNMRCFLYMHMVGRPSSNFPHCNCFLNLAYVRSLFPPCTVRPVCCQI